MSMPKPVERARPAVRSTVDLVLLTSLLNKEVNAQQRVFNVKIERTTEGKWQVWVEHFKHTYMQINPEELAHHAQMENFAKGLAKKLLDAMQVKTTTEFGKLKPAKVEDKK